MGEEVGGAFGMREMGMAFVVFWQSMAWDGFERDGIAWNGVLSV